MQLPQPDAPSIPIHERRAAAIHRVAELRREQGNALLEGQSFDHAPLLDAEREIEALEAAEGAIARREREAAAKVLADARRKMRKQIGGHEQKRLDAIDRAERAASDLAGALKEALDAAAEISVGVRLLGLPPVRYLEANDYRNRLSCRLAWAFLPLTGPGRHFGQISFPDSGMYRVSWLIAEAALVQPSITLATQGKPDEA